MSRERFKRYVFLVRAFLIRSGWKRAEFFRARHYFHSQGEKCYFQIYNFGTEPHLIEIGNNVSIAKGVTFVNHDIVSFVFNRKYNTDLPTRVNTITIGNNVFIGANAIILPGARIHDNVIIAAGAVVNGDVEEGAVVGGVPGKIIGKFEKQFQDYKEVTASYSWKQNDPDKRDKQAEFFWK